VHVETARNIIIRGSRGNNLLKSRYTTIVFRERFRTVIRKTLSESYCMTIRTDLSSLIRFVVLTRSVTGSGAVTAFAAYFAAGNKSAR